MKLEGDQGVGNDLSECRGTESRSIDLSASHQHLEVKPKFQVTTVSRQ